MTGLFDDVATAEEHEADLREREADYTPPGVVRQILRECLRLHPPQEPAFGWALHANGPVGRWLAGDHLASGRPMRVLDWCAGAGVWSQEMRAFAEELNVPVHITAVEIDERERPNLERHCDEVWIVGFESCPILRSKHPPMFDLVIGNPAFSLLHRGIPPLLSVAKAVLVLHTIECLHRSAAGRSLGRQHPPACQYDVGGSIKFRGRGRGADLRSYAAWLWVGQRTPGSSWQRTILPDLDAADRAWVRRPGSEF